MSNNNIGNNIWKNVAIPKSCLEPLKAKFRASTVKVVTLPAPIKYTGTYKEKETITPIENEVKKEGKINGILILNNQAKSTKSDILVLNEMIE